jgi:hypothetical protein
VVILVSSLGADVRGARAEGRVPGFKPAPELKYGNTAFAYSLFGTALPAVATSIIISREGEASAAAAGFPVLAGYLAGPSLGHFYAGRPKRALFGIGIRTAAAAAFTAGLAIEAEKGYDAPSANGLMLVSLMVGLSSVVVDVFDAPRSARIHNEGLETRLNVAPVAIGVAKAPGLRVDVTF